MKIVICASARFFAEVVTLRNQLQAMGFEVILPMAEPKAGEESEVIIDWAKGGAGYHRKAMLMQEYFSEIAQGDFILVANYTKGDKANYIGPNVLMEMAVGFYLRKPIYVLHDCPKQSPFKDEILGLEPIFLNGDTTRLPRS